MTDKKAQKGFVPDYYDPVEYWNTRSQPNTEKAPGISQMHSDFFHRNIGHAPAILELGPGVGRLFALYKNSRDGVFATLDLTRQHERTVELAAREQNLVVKQYFIAEADAAYPFADNQFDIGVSSFVFIHVPFEYIRHSMSEMARTCRKVIVFASDNPAWPKTEAERKPSTHVFGHDYQALCSDLGLVVHDYALFPSNKGFNSVALCYGRA